MEINDFKRPRKDRHKPLLRSQIEDAIKNTRSNSQAAKYLGVHPLTYKKYASIYGLYDQHSNKRGVGVSKGFINKGVKIEDVFAGKHIGYNLVRLKHRMIARRIIKEECSYCNFSERRITDKKSPLILTFKDGDRKNYNKDNLHLVCYNCMFLTSGAPSVAHQNHIEYSFENPDAFVKDKKLNVSHIELDNPPDIQVVDEDIDWASLRDEIYNEMNES